jgi:hypothetical protein
MTRFRCIHCGDDTGTSDSRICGRCAVLVRELGETVVEPPRERQPGDDDQPGPRKPLRDGNWLIWAARKRGRLRDVFTIGHSHGFPRRVEQWSPAMVEIAVKAMQSPTIR